MRKKHDEGYALVFVLVVMTVLSALAIALMSGALRNLQAQNAAVERMQAKYQAQGVVEMTVATLEEKLPKYNPGSTATGATYLTNDLMPKIAKDVEDYLKAVQDELDENSESMTWRIIWVEKPSYTENQDLILEINAVAAGAHAKCKLLLSDIVRYSVTEVQENKAEKWEYESPKISYQEYQVSNVGGGT